MDNAHHHSLGKNIKQEGGRPPHYTLLARIFREQHRGEVFSINLVQMATLCEAAKVIVVRRPEIDNDAIRAGL